MCTNVCKPYKFRNFNNYCSIRFRVFIPSSTEKKQQVLTHIRRKKCYFLKSRTNIQRWKHHQQAKIQLLFNLD